jgi:hypothetical protein
MHAGHHAQRPAAEPARRWATGSAVFAWKPAGQAAGSRVDSSVRRAEAPLHARSGQGRTDRLAAPREAADSEVETAHLPGKNLGHVSRAGCGEMSVAYSLPREGYTTNEVPLVVEEGGRYVVLEANRRASAQKCPPPPVTGSEPPSPA